MIAFLPNAKCLGGGSKKKIVGALEEVIGF